MQGNFLVYFRKSLKHWKWTFLSEVKHLIWSALEIKFFEVYFLQPVLGSHPVLSRHLAIPRGWPLNTDSTVFGQVILKVRSLIQNLSSEPFSAWSSQLIWYKPKILKTKNFEHNLSPMILHVIGNQMVYSWNCTFRLRKLLGFGQNMCESIPYFHSTAFDYTY